MKHEIAFLLVLSFSPVSATASSEPDDVQEQPVEKRFYETARIQGEAPTVDGSLDDPVWETVEWSGDFVQRDPTDGDPPSQETRFKVVYDDTAIYFAFDIRDDPEKVSNLLARRDWFPGDWVEVNIDSYFDRRTAFSFSLSLSGTRGDELVSDDGNNWNSNWDPVWTGATELNGQGWTAETKILLSQLRFSDAPDQTWGLQVLRRIFRLEERSTWQHIPKDSQGWVSQFGELRGLKDLKPKRRIELIPYGVASTERFPAESGNPFRDGSDNNVEGGLDGKIGVSNNLTLDFTLNPDFGQVEADPSEVNLSVFETFFEERRPFFIEGKEIFDFRLAPAITGGSFTRDILFYSRRLGKPPSLYPEVPDGGFVDVPDLTTILGAFKLSGKTASGLSIGILESLTAEEKADVYLDGERSRAVVEPLTNFFAGRLQQDYRDGDTRLGGMVTAVNRRIDDVSLEFLTEDAYALGIDFSSYFKNRDYEFEASILGSEIRGSEESIYDAQTSSRRYYQRPDNDYVDLDPTRTSLSGHAGSFRLNRSNNHDLRFQTGVAWRSPGFEINDMGFMRSADGINQFTWVGYTKRNPFLIFDRWSLNGNQWMNWDYGGNFLGAAFNVNSNANFKNKTSAGMGITRNGEFTSNTQLRGGPASVWPGNTAFNVWWNSDRRKSVYGSLGTYMELGDESSGDFREVWARLTYRPTDAMQISLRPSVSMSDPEMQYIDTQAFGEDDRYIFGQLDQETVALTLRVDYSITPNLTIQYYGSPFVSVGRYDAFKRITDPQADSYRDRFSVFGDEQISHDPNEAIYHVDENRDGSADYSFDDPDFDVRDFNSNLVLRWEYQPGSTLFVVWSQARTNFDLRGEGLDFGDDLDILFSEDPEDVLLIKVSKWFSP